MANLHRGEIDAVLDGLPRTLCLTLGALAELESAFGADDMLALAERFRSGRLTALDATRIIGAGLRGAGHDIADDQVTRLRAAGGAAGYVDIVARLLGATFGGTAGAAAASVISGAFDDETAPTRAAARSATPDPFPGLM